MKALSRMFGRSRKFLNFGVTFVSVLLCLLILPTRMPGMELLGISPNWLLIWLVAWSIKRKRTVWGAASMGVVLGFLQDAMTAPHPSHAVSLVIVGVLTVVLLKTWSIPADIVERDPIPIALIVFGMAVVAETVMGLQFLAVGDRALVEIWSDHQRVALCSAILSSLWAPVIYFPLNHLWEMTRSLEKS
ncbi:MULTISPECIES: rod shape-determining protein MreD [Microcoleaceae]|uniref:rod shape-determining protein MreD n=1 Tax=Microcoleaceae TaxID=1892252 RepID=UPI00187F6807|nr:rod shape-determining protein MreD [Tychonema sp. LEGE 06208]MBE9164923.1 rod shape-determining protein MreD [Tychonema sp. LEGE 06208]